MIAINKSKIKLVLYLFLFIFAPPLIPKVSVIHILFAFSLTYMMINWRTSLKVFFRQKSVKYFLGFFSMYFLYILSRVAYSLVTSPINMDNYLVALYKYYMVLVEIPVCCAFVVIYCWKHRFSYDDLLKILIWVGLIQVVVGGCMIVSPSIKRFLVSYMQKNNGSSIDKIAPWEYNRRYNAISDCMLDMLGWGLGIISAIPLYIEGKGRHKYLIAIPFLILITVANSTTGIIMFVLMVCIGVLGKLKKISNNKLLIVGMCMVGLVGAVIAMKYIVPSTYAWTVNEMKAILGMKTEKVSSYSKVMSSDFRVFPDNIVEFFFGTGHTVYRAKGFLHSDLGYVNNIWLGGIVGIVIIYLIYLFLFGGCIKTKHRGLIMALAISVYVFELKGMGICYNPGMVLVVLLTFAAISMDKKKQHRSG